MNGLDPLIVLSVSVFLQECQAAADVRGSKVREELTAQLSASHPALEERVEQEQLYWSWVSNTWRDTNSAWARANEYDEGSLGPCEGKSKGKGK